MEPASDQGQAPPRHEGGESPLVSLTGGLAVAGSLLVLAVAGLVVTSVVRRWLTDDVVMGAVEIVEIATALAVFSFLPLAQARRVNVVVDTFTTGLSPRARDRLDGFWDGVYAVAAGLIAWQLVLGALGTISSRTTSMVLGLPTGYAIMACAGMAGLLALVAALTARRLLRGAAR